MNTKEFNENLFQFIKKATCSFTGILEIKKQFIKNGFLELYENQDWNIEYDKKYFVIRNDASIIAFQINKSDAFNIVCSHIDTPALAIKPKHIIYEKEYLKINVMPYGGLLNYAWLDEELSIAGRVITKNKNTYTKEIIDYQKPLLLIPSVAIHENDEANTNLEINSQIDLIPILSLQKEKEPINKIINKLLNTTNAEICDYDLFLYSTTTPIYFGLNEEFIVSPRIDDLSCVYSSLQAFLNCQNKQNSNLFCSFNSEEIGSLTKEGADSSFLMDILKRIAASLNLDINKIINNSTILSADNTHATHPNHPGNSDVNNQAFLNKGVVISKDPSSTTDSITSSLFKGICEKANVPYQDFVTKNDKNSGSTLSGISLRHVSIDTIDIGISELAMHGAKETIGSKDPFYLYQALKKYYEITIRKDKNKFYLEL